MRDHALRIEELLSSSPPGPSNSQPDNPYPTSYVADGLEKLIQLFDDVLQEGYCEDHDSLFLPDHLPDDPTCHYCGGSLFLSYFSCAGTCFDLETDSPRLDVSIRICSACYVEGRSCSCKEMNPTRLCNFSDILKERNDAASTLSNYLASRLVHVDHLGAISER